MKHEQGSPTVGVMHDPLYGELPYTADDLRLYQTPELTRLRQVSLSAVAPWLLPTGNPATKFGHSLGAAHLARIVGEKPEFSDVGKDLYFAALAHDLGTPPFSHTSEHFQRHLFGMDHEQFVEVVMDGSDFAKEVMQQGGSPERIIDFVKGEGEIFSDIINGSIDVDNLDNTLRWSSSMGMMPPDSYSPEVLAASYAMREGELVMEGDITAELASWEQVRRKSYEYIYNPPNQAAGIMLWQALYFAAEVEELPKEYFFMTDAQAFEYLENDCNPRTRTIVERAKNWHIYQRAYNYATTEPSEAMQAIVKQSMKRGEIAKELSREIGVESTEVTVYVGKNKGFKQIHMPILTKDGETIQHEPAQELTWMAQVYVEPSVSEKREAIRDYMETTVTLP